MLIQRNDLTFKRTRLNPLKNIYPYPQQLALQGVLRAWFSADKNVLLSGSDVTSWTDRSSNAVTVTNAGSPHPLIYTPSAQNGLPDIQTGQTATLLPMPLFWQ